MHDFGRYPPLFKFELSLTRSGCVLALGRWSFGELLRRRADDCQPGASWRALGASVPACKFLCGISTDCNRHFTRIPGDRLGIFGTISCRICGNFNGDFSAIFGGFSARESAPLREHPNPEPDSGSNPNWNPKSKKVPCHFLMIFLGEAARSVATGSARNVASDPEPAIGIVGNNHCRSR